MNGIPNEPDGWSGDERQRMVERLNQGLAAQRLETVTDGVVSNPWPLVRLLMQRGYHLTMRDCDVHGGPPGQRECRIAHPERPPVAHHAPSYAQAICEAFLVVIEGDRGLAGASA